MVGVFLGAMLALGLAVVLLKIRSVFLPFILGFFIAYVLDPVLDRFERLGLTRTAAVWLVTIVFLGLLTVFFATVGPLVVSQLQALAADLPEYGQRIQSYYNAHEDQFERYLSRFVEREPGRLRSLDLPVWSDGGGGELSVVLTDRTGEAFSYDGGALDWSGWRSIPLMLRAGPGGQTWTDHKGGDANGVVDQPVNHVALVLGAQRPPNAGRIALGDPTSTEDATDEGEGAVTADHPLPVGLAVEPDVRIGASADASWEHVSDGQQRQALVLRYSLPRSSSQASVSVPVRIPSSAISLLDELALRVQQAFSANLPVVVQNALNLARGSLTVLLLALLVMLISFHFMLVIDPFRRGLLDVIPEQRRDYARVVANEITRMLGAYVRGLTVVCIMVGVSATILLLVLSHAFHMKYALLLGLLTGLTYAIPYVGATVSAALSGIVGALTAEQSPILCGVLAASIQIGINQFYDNVVMPKIVGQRVGLHPLAVIFGLMAGYQLWGIVGMLVAVPLVASIKIVVQRAYPAFARADAEPAEARRGRQAPPLLPIITRRLPSWLRRGPLAAEPVAEAEADPDAPKEGPKAPEPESGD